jgi:hypothetical protein
MGLLTATAYDHSAREMTRIGVRFTYQLGRYTNVGYYHRPTNRFTALDGSQAILFTHFCPANGEQYVRGLVASTHPY